MSDDGNLVDISPEDDVLPLPIHDQLSIGHPDGEHVVEPIPIHAIPLGGIPTKD
ncbi:hypothetical protein Hanom_Chr01g00049041 [Helianthus anomalus]